MKLLLLAHGSRSVPRGLADIYFFLRERGYDVQFLHLYDKVDRLNTIADTPEYVGISAYTQISQQTRRLVQIIRQRWPSTQIIVGGRHFCDDVLEIEDWPNLVEYVVVGEGEYALADILDGCTVPGVVHGKDLSAEDYRQLPMPDRSFVCRNFKAWLQAVMFARGCPYNCVFCTAHRRKLVRKSPEVAVAYLKQLTSSAKGKVYIQDDVFATDRTWLGQFVDEIRKQNVHLPLRCFIHGRGFDDEFMELLLQAGVVHFTLGAESGDNRILQMINKHTTVGEYVKLNQCFRSSKAKVKLHALWMFGNIGETIETMKATLSLAKRIGNCRPSFGFAIPFPGTAFWKLVSRYGTVCTWDFSKWDTKRVVFVPKDVTAGQMRNCCQKARAK